MVKVRQILCVMEKKYNKIFYRILEDRKLRFK